MTVTYQSYPTQASLRVLRWIARYGRPPDGARAIVQALREGGYCDRGYNWHVTDKGKRILQE